MVENSYPVGSYGTRNTKGVFKLDAIDPIKAAHCIDSWVGVDGRFCNGSVALSISGRGGYP